MYRVSQKFVPLVTCDITFDRNYTSAWYFLKTFIALLSIYIRKVSIQHTLLCLLSRSEAVAVWSGMRHVPWRAGFSSRLVRAVFLDPSYFRSWVVIDNFIHYAPKILHRVDIWGIWGPSCFLYKIWQFFLHHAWWPWLRVLAPRLGRTSCGDWNWTIFACLLLHSHFYCEGQASLLSLMRCWCSNRQSKSVRG